MIRFFDVIFSVMAIIILLPFLLPIILVLRLTGERDIFYFQSRVGKDGKIFNVIKFATMLRNSPNMVGGFITQENDPRVLPMGKFLRDTKINELPQLINIFLGEMSFVGPRPIVEQHMNLYSEDVKRCVVSSRPGLTGIGSLVFRDEEGILNLLGGDRKYHHDKIIAPYKGDLEIWYFYNKSVLTYFAIILLTALAVVAPRVNVHSSIFKNLPKPPAELGGILMR